MVLEDEGVLVAQQNVFGAMALLLSLSEVYQNLNAQSILQEMVEGKLIQPQNKRDAEAYSSEYAQNISAGVALLCKVLQHFCLPCAVFLSQETVQNRGNWP